jgi:hypothetical protein
LSIEKDLHNLEHNGDKLGLYFFATSGPLSLSANSFMGIELHNPAGSDKQVYIAQIIDVATTNTSFTLIRNGTFEGGTLIPSYNANFGSSHSSGVTVKMISQSSDPFTEALPFSTVIQPSNSIMIDFDGRIILPPNSSLGIRVASNSPQPNLVGFTICWWEHKA